MTNPKQTVKVKKYSSYFKCVVCEKPALENLVVCSEHCQKIRLRILKLIDKYFPTPGCENCRGDLHQGCTEKCQKEFSEMGKFAKDLWFLVSLILKDYDH